MICCEVEKQSANIALPSIEQEMYRNLSSDTSQPTSDSGFFQPTYSQRINSSQTYASSSYGNAQPTFSASEHAHAACNLPHEYSSQFFVSEINSHFPVESSSAAHCNWGHGGFYPSDSLPPMLNPCNSWDPNNPSLGHPHPPGLGSGFSAATDPTIQSTFIEAAENSSLPPVSLTGIESFSAGAEGSSSVALHLPALQHRALPAQRRPYEWINKNAYQNPQTQQGKTRTKDKYRVVYSDHQRLELEKEFRFSRYITIRRKSELAAQLCLSERQVKIWFQNRRAKERKASKKSTNLNPDLGDGADTIEDGETSDNSGQGGDTSPATNSVSTSQFSPSQHSNSALAYNQVPHTARSPLSQSPQDDMLEHHSSQMSYSYETKMESLGETGNFSQLSEIDIKPLLSGSNEPCRVATSIKEVNPTNNDSPTNMHHHKLNDL